jgi:hypothetical protein
MLSGSKPRTSVARFLSVAVAQGRLSLEAAQDIASFQERLRLARVDYCPRVGEIALSQGLLSRAALDDIEAERVRKTSADETLTDQVPFLVRPSGKRIKLRTVLAVCALIAFLVVALRGGSALDALKVFTVLSAIGTFIRFFGDEILDTSVSLPWHRRLQLIVWGLLVAAVPVGLYFAHQDATVSTGMSLLAGSATIGSAAALAVVAAWRQRVRWALEARLALALSPGTLGLAATNDGPGQVKDLFKACVMHLSLDPFARLADLWSSWLRTGGNGVLLLYFKPDIVQKRFVISEAAYSSVCKELSVAYEQIKAEHQPVFFDEKRFMDVRARVKQQFGEDRWIQAFRNQAERPAYVSLVGLVFSTRERVICEDLDRCPVFGHDYLDVFRNTGVPRRVLNALNFQSAIAYPVLDSADPSRTPLGVVMALRCLRDGFKDEDKETMRRLAFGISRAEVNDTSQRHEGNARETN